MAGKKNKSKRSVVIHHLGSNPISDEQENEFIETLKNGSPDLFHYVVKSDGSWIQLLEECIRAGWRGNKYAGNTGSVHVACVGDFSDKKMSASQFGGLVNLLKKLVNRYNIELSDIFQHCSLEITDCPGKYFPFVALKEKLNIPYLVIWKNSDVGVIKDTPDKLPGKVREHKGITYAPVDWLCEKLGFNYEEIDKRIEIRRKK